MCIASRVEVSLLYNFPAVFEHELCQVFGYYPESPSPAALAVFCISVMHPLSAPSFLPVFLVKSASILVPKFQSWQYPCVSERALFRSYPYQWCSRSDCFVVWLWNSLCHPSLQLPWQVGDRTVLSLPSAEKSEPGHPGTEAVVWEAQRRGRAEGAVKETEEWDGEWAMAPWQDHWETAEGGKGQELGRAWGPAPSPPTMLEGLTELSRPAVCLSTNVSGICRSPEAALQACR